MYNNFNNTNGYNMIRPQPIGNIMGISNIGYNQNYGIMGGYYNPYNQGHYNPYLLHQQQKAMEAQMREKARTQSDILKNLSRKVNSITGAIKNIDEHVKRYDPIDYNNEDYVHEMNYNKLLNMQNNIIPSTNNYRFYLINKEFEKTKKEFPDDMSLMDFFDKAGSIILDIRMKESKERQKNIGKLYDKNDYNDLIKLHSGNNNYFNSVFSTSNINNNIDIDDMEVKLPSSINTEYYEKKRAFLESIFK